MTFDADLCYRALTSRDRRFDGRFFIGVRTTGVYCRPVCPAPTPKRRNVRFFACAAAAQAAGFRPCKRCRPETAPGTPAWVGSSAVVARALRLIGAAALDEAGVPALAQRLGIGERQLRRLFARHLGASPVEIASARRVHFARRLLDETGLPITEIALAAGFRSLRQFHHAFRATFAAAPGNFRRSAAAGKALVADAPITIRLPFRPPLDWQAHLGFFAARAIPGVERVAEGSYARTVEIGGRVGWIAAEAAGNEPHLRLRVALDAPADLFRIVERARRLFDLDADPARVAEQLGRSGALAPLIMLRPGLRVPGAWDGFEIAVRAVLGQQISVRAATTLAGRLVSRFGAPVSSPQPGLTHLFPTPEALAGADLSAIGLTRARAATLRALADGFASGRLRLDPARSLEETVAALEAIPGIGRWTAQYVSLRALGEPDAFPAGDLGIRRALGNGRGPLPERQVASLAEAWRPWRAYAAIHLWKSLGSPGEPEEE